MFAGVIRTCKWIYYKVRMKSPEAERAREVFDTFDKFHFQCNFLIATDCLPTLIALRMKDSFLIEIFVLKPLSNVQNYDDRRWTPFWNISRDNANYNWVKKIQMFVTRSCFMFLPSTHEIFNDRNQSVTTNGTWEKNISPSLTCLQISSTHWRDTWRIISININKPIRR